MLATKARRPGAAHTRFTTCRDGEEQLTATWMARPPSRETCEPCATSPTESSDEEITHAVLIVSAVSFAPAPLVACAPRRDTVRVRSQITKGLASQQLRSGRGKNSKATSGSHNRWSEEENLAAQTKKGPPFLPPVPIHSPTRCIARWNRASTHLLLV